MKNNVSGEQLSSITEYPRISGIRTVWRHENMSENNNISDIYDLDPVFGDETDSLPVFPVLSDENLTRIAEDMDRYGFGVVTHCVSPDRLASLARFVEKEVAASSGEYVAVVGSAPLTGTFLEKLPASPEFRAACEALYRKGTGKQPPSSPLYQLLRCLSGGSGEKHSFYFHYDSYILTILLPVLIPSEGRTGDLVMLPNIRRIRKTYGANLIDKVFLDRKIVQGALKKMVTSGILPVTRIRMVPGNIYFFWGYRSIHANEPCDRHRIRATALLHYGNPHEKSPMRNAVTRGRAAIMHGLRRSTRTAGSPVSQDSASALS